MPVVRTYGRAVGRCTVTWLPNFLGWVVYHIFLPMVLLCARFARESSAIKPEDIHLLSCYSSTLSDFILWFPWRLRKSWHRQGPERNPTVSLWIWQAKFKLSNRVFSLTWPASMQIYWNKRKRLHKKRVQLPEDWFGTTTWPHFHCFGTPIWPPWRHVKMLYSWHYSCPRSVYCRSIVFSLVG